MRLAAGHVHILQRHHISTQICDNVIPFKRTSYSENNLFFLPVFGDELLGMFQIFIFLLRVEVCFDDVVFVDTAVLGDEEFVRFRPEV